MTGVRGLGLGRGTLREAGRRPGWGSGWGVGGVTRCREERASGTLSDALPLGSTELATPGTSRPLPCPQIQALLSDTVVLTACLLGLQP